MTGLESLIIETAKPVVVSIIWLHGLGADGHDFEPIVPELNLGTEIGIRFIFPHAPVRPITINNGMAMRGWYDIGHPDLGNHQDLAGIQQSASEIGKLVDQEINQGHEVILAGFSQGGVVALQTGLHNEKPLRGMLILSSYLADQGQTTLANKPNQNTPIMMMHGSHDPVVPVDLGKRAFESLKSAGYRAEWREYPMPHSIHPQQIRDIASWLKTIIGK